jgi:hypothetical protein
MGKRIRKKYFQQKEVLDKTGLEISFNDALRPDFIISPIGWITNKSYARTRRVNRSQSRI